MQVCHNNGGDSIYVESVCIIVGGSIHSLLTSQRVVSTSFEPFAVGTLLLLLSRPPGQRTQERPFGVTMGAPWPRAL